MKVFRSKKGFTLLELVVTITIASIVSGMGIGIFASVMRSYTTASVTASDQQAASLVEDFILTNARSANDVIMIRGNLNRAKDGVVKTASVIMETDKKEGAFMVSSKKHEEEEEADIKTYYGIKIDSDVVPQPHGTLHLKGLNRVEFRISRHKVSKTDPEEGSFMFLVYTIVMQSGYTIQGEVTLNNCTNMKPTNTADSYYDDYTEIVVGNKNFDSGIAFVKTKTTSPT